MFVWKRPKIDEKEAGLALFKKTFVVEGAEELIATTTQSYKEFLP